MKTSRALVAAQLALLLVSAACSGGRTREFKAPDVDGPPEVEAQVVSEHAEQFDKDLKVRVAGSEEEQAAASYILGILQQNGYFVRLEAVPVADLFQSTNVIAQPASGDVPTAMVVLPYSNAPGVKPDGPALGLFLELARALNVADPTHSVQFTALGAEFAEAEGGNLGSRRLAQLLIEEDKDPFIVQFADISPSGPASITGDRADEATSIAEDLAVAGGSVPETLEPDVFKSAGFDRLVISGGVEAVGALLVEFLQTVDG
jgi:hypothetical protein